MGWRCLQVGWCPAVVSSLRVWLLVSPSTPEGQAGIHDVGQYPPDTARAGYFQCELPLCPSLAEKCPHLYANALSHTSGSVFLTSPSF